MCCDDFIRELEGRRRRQCRVFICECREVRCQPHFRQHRGCGCSRCRHHHHHHHHQRNCRCR